MKVQLEHNSRTFPLEATIEEVGHVDKIVSNVPFKDKTNLIITDKRGNKRLKTHSEHFRNAFDSALLEGDGAKFSQSASNLLLWEQDNVRFVNALKIYRMTVEKTGTESIWHVR